MNRTHMRTAGEVEQWIYASYMAAKDHIVVTLDAHVRRPQLTRFLLDRLGSPDRHGYNVMITGSKGKGSTAVLLASILQKHGWRVGLFTSPHLTRFTERIRVNGKVIPDDVFTRIGQQVKEAAAPLISSLKPHEYMGPMGLTAAIAALYFQEQQTEINVWECGRGALWDDVNQLHHEGAIVTPIMEEHLTYLGPELKDVVKHKIGIVTPSVCDVWIGRQEARVLHLMQALATKHTSAAKTIFLGEDVDVDDVCSGINGTRFSMRMTGDALLDDGHASFTLPLLGAFQADNAALAVAAAAGVVRRLQSTHSHPRGSFSIQQVQQAFDDVRWPGRLERLSQDPMIFVDGAIHRLSAQYVADLLSSLTRHRGVLIIGVPKDKDYVGVIEVLAPLARQVILTAANRDCLNFPSDAIRVAKRFCSQVEFKERAAGAFQTGLLELKAGEWMGIVGTQSLVGEAYTFFKGREMTPDSHRKMDSIGGEMSTDERSAN